MVGGNYFNILKRRSRSSSRKRRCSRGGREMLRTTGFDSLPDDILMEILIRIPAKDIVDSTKLVCRKWREITSTHDFAYAHLHLSTPGFLAQNNDHGRTEAATFMSLTQGVIHQVQISDLIHTSEDGYFWTSCNGLTLEPKFNDNGQLMITNPVTRQHFYLPPFMAPTIKYDNMRSAIAYVATRNEYKVVRTYHPQDADQNRVRCAILTVGVDNSWRVVDTHHLSPEASFKLNYSTLVTEGFVHWVDNCGGYDNKHILSLNMETEVMSQIFAPRSTDQYYYDYKYLSAGSSLSLLISVGRLKWEVWEMKPSESGEYCWTKLPDIYLEAHRALLNEWCRKEENEPLFKPAGDKDADRLDCCVYPSGWLKYREVIVFYDFKRFLSCRFHVVYDVQTKDVSLYKSEYGCSFPHVVHRNSLVWIR